MANKASKKTANTIRTEDLSREGLLIEMAVAHRRQLLESLPENSAVLVASGGETIRNRDVEYPFRASSDFFYLTGFSEPDSVLLLVKKESLQSVLFVRPRDSEQEVWQGRRLGVEMAPAVLGVNRSYSIEELQEQVEKELENIQQIFFSFQDFSDWIEPVGEWLAALKTKSRKGVGAPASLMDLDPLLHERRLIKSDSEIALMRQAAQISVAGHLAAMRHAAPGLHEYQLQAEMESEFVRQGARKVAFNSIVASGDNACILHYTENSDRIGEHHLILVDAGAEFRSYAGDITTTFPASGRFSKEQAALYELVLKAQQTAVSMVKPGLRFNELHQKVMAILTEGLLQLGLLNGTLEDLIASEACKRFFMHGTGHWLGMDVHDVGSYKQENAWRKLKPGMVLTVEPGLYVAPELEGVDDGWKGIGIRIEDDVLVTTGGHEVLTAGLPRTVTEIERWMAKNNLHCAE